MTGFYIPYITCSKKERMKIRAILDHGINIDGLVIDYRRLSGNYKRETTEIIVDVYNSNPEAIILVDPRTDAFQVNKSIRGGYKSLKKIFRLADYDSDDVIKEDKYFEPNRIRTRLKFIIDNLYKETRIPRINAPPLEPSFFIPPYFVARSYGDDWYNLTLESINIALKKFKGKVRILAPIAVDKNVFSYSNDILKIIDDYKALDVDGYIVFPYNVNELNVSGTILENLTLLSTELKSTGKFVIVHIAEFGNVLISLGIDAITCGICSHKTPYDFIMFEKGLAEIARTEDQLYIHSIFRKLYTTKFAKFYELLQEAFSCDCPICQNYRNSYLDLVEEAGYTDFSIHYMYWKNDEIESYSNNPDRLLRDLKKAKTVVNTYNERVGDEYFFIEETKYKFFIDPSYLDKWSNVLRTFSHSDSTNL